MTITYTAKGTIINGTLVSAPKTKRGKASEAVQMAIMLKQKLGLV